MTKHEAIIHLEQARCEYECMEGIVAERDDEDEQCYLRDLAEKAEAYRMAIMALERWEAPKGWVPVDKDLPAVGTTVLVTRIYRDTYVVEAGVRRPGGNGWWRVPGANTKAVVAWMPLPDPCAPWNQTEEEDR